MSQQEAPITVRDIDMVMADFQEVDERGHVFRCVELGDVNRLLFTDKYKPALQRVVDNIVKDLASGVIDTVQASVQIGGVLVQDLSGAGETRR